MERLRFKTRSPFNKKNKGCLFAKQWGERKDSKQLVFKASCHFRYSLETDTKLDLNKGETLGISFSQIKTEIF